MKIKVCGITEPANMEAVLDLGVDHIGWIMYKDSPRNALTAADILSTVSRNDCQVVGVFVNTSERTIADAISRWQLDLVQLHGTESNLLCQKVGKLVPVIKAIHISAPADLDKCLHYPDAGMFLLDTKTAAWGGSGQTFNWSWLERYAAPQPFFLSGGIGPGMAKEIAALRHPQLTGIDLNSRFEDAPGHKNAALLATFINDLKASTHVS
ncbi:MAG: phosphoribosylanthranilate isomerase [Saprospiraceae bacterium]|nr:phosphoribosylanthranilate isomerase [Saprospiraceae bacterium]